MQAVALMPRVTFREAGPLKLKPIRITGENLVLEIGLLRLIAEVGDDSHP
jgi:hypothetical protein